MNEERCEYYKICTTDCDCTLEDTECCSLYELHDKLKRLEQKYNEVLKLAKENADSNEYVIQELEKENEELKYEIGRHKRELLKLLQTLKKINNCATTELAKILSEQDYNGFFGLKEISTTVFKTFQNEVLNEKQF